ncbi:ABC transporter ATP-binding protein/permease [Nocardia caishijiensis]|uniref:Peptide/nickel transport system ATP-binding protein/peptide/nickel transport system permease protein n=1 Tax=Nocardia caishijiensis TaxID=184756 RepID=A0ABQ6YP50_9NOCA|nr:ATP-binding cassette domain-containing protein [Nocardia caishijiensis]KAF0847264.1 peptide/nickel transport system ATP-binding protein/peptide/nickel transport system permease protein [Nocardia caishijiensis]
MRNRGGIRSMWLAVTVALLLLVALGPLLAPYSPTEVTAPPFRPPSARHLLGTDVVGRDVAARVLHGGLPLLSIAGLSLIVAYALGLGLGLLVGLRREWDRLVMRPVDAITVLPWFLLLAVIATAMGAGPAAIVVTAALASVPWIIRIVRTRVLELASTGYVESARARGEPLWRLGLVEVLPNLRTVVLADAGVRMSATISLVAVSGFLGLGLRPPAPDWALMIIENRPGFALQPWSVLAPALLIMVLVVSVNMVTDRAFGADQPSAAHHPMRVSEAGSGLTVNGLTVRDPNGALVLEDISVHVRSGGSVAVVGASGAGKTTLALAVLGALPPELTAVGSVGIGRSAGRRTVGYVPQDPATGLNPALRIGTTLREIAGRYDTVGVGNGVAEALRRVDLPDDRRFRRRFPHELSGGQQQRVLLAMALLGDPALLVLDEPTTGLDAHTRDRLVRTLRQIRRDSSTTLLVITHDLAALEPLVDHVLTLDRGRVESMTAHRTSRAATVVRVPPIEIATTPILRVENLSVTHRRGRDAEPVVDGLSFTLHAGECLAITGRSGAGKTTLARAISGLHAPVGGIIELDGTALRPGIDRRPSAHRRAIQLIPQNPATSLNPSYRIGGQISRPLRHLHGMSSAAASARARSLLDAVGLDSELAARRPDQLSGGQQQRAAIARALAANPRILICDEITTALDPNTQNMVLDLLEDLRRKGMALIVISHQDTVIDRLADRVLGLSERITRTEES